MRLPSAGMPRSMWPPSGADFCNRARRLFTESCEVCCRITLSSKRIVAMSLAHSWRISLLGALVLLGAGGVLALLFLSPHEEPKEKESPPQTSSVGFQERAQAAGITFRMQFLTGEQGERFKINLYDHGCGIAVADYNGDGADDIYLVNQLGHNALYKNKGDGTFVDVTEEAGVGLGDRICVGAVFGDYDNDGRQDLFVTSTRGGN